MYKKIQNISDVVLINLLLITIISDALSKILLVNGISFHRIGLFTKALVFALFFGNVISRFKKTRWEVFKYIILLVITVLISVSTTILVKGYDYLYIKDVLFLIIAYSYLPMLAIVFFDSEKKEDIIKSNIKALKIASIINGLLALLNLALILRVFKSYPFSERFGNNGLLLTASTSSYFYVFLITIFYYQFIKKKEKSSLLLLLFNVFVGLLVGTKTVWFFTALLFIIHFCFVIKNPYKNIIRVLLVTLLALAFAFQKKIELFIISLFSFGEEVYQEHGIISVITSTRDLYLIKAFENLESEGIFLNYIFGGINVMKHGVEFEFVNLFLFFGVFGLIVYLVMLKKIFLKSNTALKIGLFGAVLLTAALAGGFFYSFLSTSLFFITFMYIDQLNKTN